MALYPTSLSVLPAGFALMTPDARARVLLGLKNEDGTQYRLLRGQALRCAR